MRRDWNDIGTLVHIIDLCRPGHYPEFDKIRGEAMTELREILDYPSSDRVRVVTPPAGPANSALRDERTGEIIPVIRRDPVPPNPNDPGFPRSLPAHAQPTMINREEPPVAHSGDINEESAKIEGDDNRDPQRSSSDPAADPNAGVEIERKV